MIEKAEKEVDKVEKQYLDGVITNGERYNKVLSIWWNTVMMLQELCIMTLKLKIKNHF